MRSVSKLITLIAVAALACRADAAVIYRSQFRELSVQRTTFPPSGTRFSTSNLGSFALTRSTQRLVPWMGVPYLVFASATIDSEIDASGISASGSLAASGIPASAQFPPEILGIARVEMSAVFTVDADTPFKLTASMLMLRSSDRFGIELQDSSGNYLVRIDEASSSEPIAVFGTLAPGEYVFHYLAELKSGTRAETDYSVALTIPAPSSIILGCTLVPLARLRFRPRVPAALA
jgi:hypothetical protein